MLSCALQSNICFGEEGAMDGQYFAEFFDL